MTVHVETTPPERTLHSTIRIWDRRLRLTQSVTWLPRALAAGLLVGVGVAVISRLRPWLLLQDILLVTGVALLIALVVALLAVWLYPRPVLAAARRFDHLFGLRERTSAALELLAGSIRSNDEIARLQVEDAVSTVTQVRARDHLPLLWRWREWAGVAGLIALLFILLLLPNPQADVVTAADAQAAAIEEAADTVREVTRDVAADPNLTNEERTQLLETLQASIDVLEQPDVTPEEAFAALSDAEGALQEQGERMQQQAEVGRGALAAAAEALRDLPSVGEEPPEGATPSDMIGQASAEMGQMNADQQQQAADALDAAADAIEATNPAAAEALRNAAEAMRNGDMQTAQEQLQEAQEQLEQQQQQNQNTQQSAESINQGAQQVGQAGAQTGQQSGQQGGSQQSGQQGSGSQQSSGQQSGNQSGNQSGQQGGQSGQQSGQSGQQGQQGQQGSAGQSGQGQQGSEGQNGGGEGEGQSGAGEGGEGSGNDQSSSSTNQQGNSGGAGGGAGDAPGGDSQPDGSQSSGGQQPPQTNNPDGTGTSDYEPIYVPPSRLNPTGEETEITLEPDASDVPVQEGEFAQNPSGQSVVPYNQVFGSYQQSANDALENSYVPMGMEDVVRDYFTSIEPGN
jgi:hypothetical protein